MPAARSGYISRQIVSPRGEPATPRHAVEWLRKPGDEQTYTGLCSCRWSFTGRYGALRSAISGHLKAAVPEPRR
jgi:hypothetical protein